MRSVEYIDAEIDKLKKEREEVLKEQKRIEEDTITICDYSDDGKGHSAYWKMSVIPYKTSYYNTVDVDCGFDDDERFLSFDMKLWLTFCQKCIDKYGDMCDDI
jgi:hypothetical protein